jgi:hypothetical protein
MLRTSIATLSCALALAASGAAAQETEDCAVFGEIAERAAEARRAETGMMDAMVLIAEDYTGEEERFAGAVPLLVDWVWKLPDDQLDDGVGAAYQEACETQ